MIWLSRISRSLSASRYIVKTFKMKYHVRSITYPLVRSKARSDIDHLYLWRYSQTWSSTGLWKTSERIWLALTSDMPYFLVCISDHEISVLLQHYDAIQNSNVQVKIVPNYTIASAIHSGNIVRLIFLLSNISDCYSHDCVNVEGVLTFFEKWVK